MFAGNRLYPLSTVQSNLSSVGGCDQPTSVTVLARLLAATYRKKLCVISTLPNRSILKAIVQSEIITKVIELSVMDPGSYAMPYASTNSSKNESNRRTTGGFPVLDESLPGSHRQRAGHCVSELLKRVWSPQELMKIGLRL